jgi:hypothetical protein
MMRRSNWIARLCSDIPLSIGAVMLVLVFVGFMVLGPFSSPRGPDRRAYCSNNLHQLALGLLEYENAHGCFPAVGVRGNGRQPSMSWRVAILPCLGKRDLFGQYDPKESWDSPKNRKLVASMPDVFGCPSNPKNYGPDRKTNYMMIAGPGTIGALGDKSRNLDYLTAHAGSAETILVIEIPGEGVDWMDPCDLTIDEIIDRLKKNTPGFHGDVLIVSFCDGHQEALRRTIAPDTLRALADPNHIKPLKTEY